MKPKAIAEAGRTLSAATKSAMTKAMSSLKGAISEMESLMAKGESEVTTESMSEAIRQMVGHARLLEATQSYDVQRELICDAIEKSGIPKETMVCVREMYDDHIVYSLMAMKMGPDDDQLYQRDYTIDANQKVTLGDAVKVKQITTYIVEAAVPEAPSEQPVTDPPTPPTVVESPAVASESAVALEGDLTPLVERAVRTDGTVPLKLIAPGWGSTGFYSAAVLERDGPKVFTKGLKTFMDHPTDQEERDRPERSLRDLAGELVSDARWVPDGPGGPGLYADAKVFSPFREHIEEIGPSIGVSIRALGRVVDGEAEGRKGKLVENIAVARSADYVTAGGAGGKVMQLLESARAGHSGQSAPHTEREMEELEEARRELATARAEASSRQSALSEAQSKLAEAEAKLAKAEPAMAKVERLQERLLLREAADLARIHLRTSDLPDVTIERLIREAASRPPVNKEGNLDEPAFIERLTESARSETAYIAQVTDSGRVRGMGGPAAVNDLAATEKDLSRALGRLGLNESANTIAVQGRA